jgi:hypothetical protein
MGNTIVKTLFRHLGATIFGVVLILLAIHYPHAYVDFCALCLRVAEAIVSLIAHVLHLSKSS